MPIYEDTQPNPYLHDPLRDLRTVEGLRLTKINSAYMTRQVAEIAQEHDSVQFHITNLTPLRPENAPQDWERPWLEDFDRGAGERGAFVKENNVEVYRYMAPLLVQESCLQCHGEANFKIGDVRGGISLTMPAKADPLRAMILSHLAAITIGAGLIVFLSSRLVLSRSHLLRANASLSEEIRERRQAQEALKAANEHLDERVRERTDELTSANQVLHQKIKERARMEDALITIYNEFYQLFNSAPDGMLVRASARNNCSRLRLIQVRLQGAARGA